LELKGEKKMKSYKVFEIVEDLVENFYDYEFKGRKESMLNWVLVSVVKDIFDWFESFMVEFNCSNLEDVKKEMVEGEIGSDMFNVILGNGSEVFFIDERLFIDEDRDIVEVKNEFLNKLYFK
jgi:hypothetical protein